MSDEDDMESEAEDGESSEGSEDEDGKSGGKKKLILIIAAVVVVIIAGVGGAFFMGAFDSGHDRADVAEVVEIPPGPLVYHDFPQLVVDLKKTSSRIHYIKIKVVAEIVTRDLKLLEESELKITDKIQSYLRSQSRKELSGSAGTEKMRADITVIINQIMAPVKIDSVLFREILLQ